MDNSNVSRTPTIVWVDTKEAAQRLGVHFETLRAWRTQPGKGPAFAKFNRVIRYAITDLDAWAASRKVGA